MLLLWVRRYVLISRPTEWSDQLREKFLEGLDTFLELFKCMQVRTGRLIVVVGDIGSYNPSGHD